MRVGVLTGGGDCPGLNAVIRAVVRRGVQEYGYEFVGFRGGWRGPLEGDTVPLTRESVRGILPRGGTILKSSRTNPFKIESGVEKIKENLAKSGVDALIAIGGEEERLEREGVALGRVDEFLELPAHPVMVLRDGRLERLVPMVPERLVAVDLVAGRVTVDWHPDD